MRTHPATGFVIALVAFAAGIMVSNTNVPKLAAAEQQARLDNVVPMGVTMEGAAFFDKNTGDIWFYALGDDTSMIYAGTVQQLGRRLIQKPAFASLRPPKDDPYVAAMKSDLRNLVTAEEAYFADSVKYTDRIGRGGLEYMVTTGNLLPVIQVTRDGWAATIKSSRSTLTCTIFIGSTPLAPATREGEPKCQ